MPIWCLSKVRTASRTGDFGNFLNGFAKCLNID